MRILLVNGPNLSQLGSRDPDVYGTATLDDVVAAALDELGDRGELESFQSESEGELISRLHAARSDGTDAVVINPGALSHYSYALRDALELLDVVTVEVHLSQIHAREEFRRHSVVSPVVDVTISGAGVHSYRLGVQAALALAEAAR